MILEFITQHADRLVETGLHFLWQGTAVALLAWLGCRLVFRKPAQRSFIYLLSLLAMPVLVATTFRSLETPPVVVSPPAIDANPDLMVPTVSPQPVDSLVSSPLETSRQILTVSHWIVGAYFVGLLFMLARVIFGYRWSHRVRQNGRAVQEEDWTQALSTATKMLKIKTQPFMMWSQSVSTPVVTGVIRPMVVLPVSLVSGLSSSQAVAVLSHELAHLKRFDHVIVLVQRLLESLFFFHPAVWLLSRVLDQEREKACDDLVVEAGTNPADYAEALVLCANDQSHPLALAAAKNNYLKERVFRILNHPGKASVKVNRGGWLTIVATIVALAFVSLSPVQSQEKEREVKKEMENEEKGISAIQKKLQIQIPILDFNHATLVEAIGFLRRRSFELDPSPDPNKKGINFVVKNTRLDNPNAVIIDSLFARNFTIEEALEAICQKTNKTFKIDDVAVYLVDKEPSKIPESILLTRRWKAPENFLEFITPQAAAGREIPIPKLMQLLGVEFPEGASAAYIAAQQVLIVRNTEHNLDLVDALVKSAGEPEKEIAPENTVQEAEDKVEKEIQKIIIPKLDFTNTTLHEAVDFLRMRAFELDPNKQGVNINIFAGGKDLNKATIKRLQLTNAPLPTVLKYVCDLTKTRYQRKGRNISIFPVEE